MSKWIPVNKYGIVVEPFIRQHPLHLDLNVGDLVYIRSEKDGWAKGSVFRNRYIAKLLASLNMQNSSQAQQMSSSNNTSSAISSTSTAQSNNSNNTNASSNTSSAAGLTATSASSSASTSNLSSSNLSNPNNAGGGGGSGGGMNALQLGSAAAASLNNNNNPNSGMDSLNSLTTGVPSGGLSMDDMQTGGANLLTDIKTALDFNVSGISIFPIPKGFFPLSAIKRIEEKKALKLGEKNATTSSDKVSSMMIGRENKSGTDSIAPLSALGGVLRSNPKMNFSEEVDGNEFAESKYGFFDEKDFEIEHCFNIFLVTEEWLSFFDGSKERMDIVDRDQFERIYDILSKLFFDLQEYKKAFDLRKRLKEALVSPNDGLIKTENKLLKLQNNVIKLVEEGCNALLYDIIVRKKGKVLDEILQTDANVDKNALSLGENGENAFALPPPSQTVADIVNYMIQNEISSTALSSSSTVTTIVKLYRSYVQTLEREIDAMKERRQKRLKNHNKREAGGRGGALGRLGLPFHLPDFDTEPAHALGSDDTKQFYHLPEGNTQLLLALDFCQIDTEYAIEMDLSLYSKKSEQFVSEPFMVPLLTPSERKLGKIPAETKEGFSERRCIIKDITSNDIKEDLYIVAKFYRVGPVLLEEKAKKKDKDTPNTDTVDVKRPIWVGIADVNPTVINNIVSGETALFENLSVYQTAKEENFYALHQTLIKLANEHAGQIPNELPRDISKVSDSLIRFGLSLNMLIGEYEEVVFSKDNLRSKPVVQMLKFPSAVSPGDRRNDIYITLEGLVANAKEYKNVLVEVELYQATISTAKNPPSIPAEVKPMIPLNNNLAQDYNSGNLPSSVPNHKRKVFSSIVLYHIKNPKWKDSFRMSVEPDLIDRSIVVFKIYNCRSRHSTKELIGFAYWKMTNSTGLLDVTCKSEQDANSGANFNDNNKQPVVEVNIYKVTKKFKGGDFSGIFDFHKNPEERETHRTKGQKLVVSFNVVSTRITQNPDMKNLLDWKTQTSVSDVVNQFTFNMGDVMGIAIFIREIFGALFDILSASEDKANVPEKIFEVTYKAINNILSQKQFWPFLRVIDEYITNYFQSVNAYKWLLKFLISDLCKIQSRKEDEILREDPYDKLMPFELEQENGTMNSENGSSTPTSTPNSTTNAISSRILEETQVPAASLAKIVPVLSQSIKCIDYWAKFIVKSRENYIERYGQTEKDEKDFERQVSILMKLITVLLQHPQNAMLGVKANFLKFFSSSFFDEVNRVFKDDKKMGRAVVDFILAMNNCSAAVDSTGKTDTKKSKEQKTYSNRMLALSCVLKSTVFNRDGCRKVVLPYVIDVIRDGILETNGGDLESGILLLNELLHATQKLMLEANRKQLLIFNQEHNLSASTPTSFIKSMTENYNSPNYSFQKKRKTISASWMKANVPQEGENFTDGLVKTIYEIYQLFQTIKDRYELLTSESQVLKKEIDDKTRLLLESQNESDQSKQAARRGGGGVTRTNVNQGALQKEIDDKQKSLDTIENNRRDLMCSIISFVKMYSGSSVLLLSHLIQDEHVATGLSQQTVKNILYLHELITGKNNNIPREWIGFRLFMYNTLFRSLVSTCNVLLYHFTSYKNSLTNIVNNINDDGETAESVPSEFKELWDLLFKHCFSFINWMEVEKMRTYERIKIQSRHEDYRFLLLHHLYEKVYKHENMKKDIKLIFVPKLVHQIMSLFNIDNRLLHDPAIKLYYALLETEFENHKRLAQCEAVTQSRVVRSKIGSLFKENFTDKLKTMFQENLSSSNAQKEELGKEGMLLLNRLETLISQVEQIQTYEDKDEHKFCEACIDVMRSFKVNHNYDLYYQYVDKLSAVHERNGNFIEAALVLYKHAKRLQWNDERKLPYHSDEYPEQSEAERKIKLYEKMIDLLDKGKDWERAIELSRQLRNYYLHNYKYAKTQNLLKREGEFYNLIMTKRRFFASYYYVNFMGKGFLKMGLQGPYIYKSVEGENFMDFLNGLKDKYQAQLFQKVPADPEQYRNQEGRYFVAFHVDQSSETEWENIFMHRDKRISPKILCYRKLHNVNYFKSESRYRESKEKTNNEYKDMHREITFYITPKKFPTICRRQRVLVGDALKIYEEKLLKGEKLKYKDYSSCIDLNKISYIANDKLLHLCPLENAIKDIEDKVNELEELVINHHLDQQPDTNALSMSLNGTIDAAVNGGQDKYISAFFTEQYVNTHPEHDHLLKRFKVALQNQIFILEEGLRQRRLFVEGKALALNDYLETRLQEMKKKLEELLFK
ncbi:hypothetical protein FDP41_007088 [Naegleria fowleri]|uniref:Uncharacterized protein n=1 Tax=Naegleria fowleri TaxID=5763 RepID=A0A6A5BGX9_NAEFO|nr:uncharacterized protein FDP41_007088 [Naegleria fowleri]KAF0973701.1 hypothetical protein FDP41_007088 [Naegleria fowleri]